MLIPEKQVNQIASQHVNDHQDLGSAISSLRRIVLGNEEGPDVAGSLHQVDSYINGGRPITRGLLRQDHTICRRHWLRHRLLQICCKISYERMRLW